MVGVRWDRLFHAYDVATDVPEHLAALDSGDQERVELALDFIDGAVCHQGTIYPATPPVVAAIVELLDDPVRVARLPRAFDSTALVELLIELGLIMRSASYADPAEAVTDPTAEEIDTFLATQGEDRAGPGIHPVFEAMSRRAALDARAQAPEVAAVAVKLLSAGHGRDVRTAAAYTIGLAGALLEPRDRPPLVETISGPADSPDERAARVLALRDLQADLSPWLDDDHLGVRLCAALAVPSERATTILVAALETPAQVVECFADEPRRLSESLFDTMLAEVIDREVSLERLLPAALIMVRTATGYGVRNGWGRFFRYAFPVDYPDGRRLTELERIQLLRQGRADEIPPRFEPPTPTDLSQAQRELLRGLTASEGEWLWDPMNGDVAYALRDVGLPRDREALARLAES